MITDYTSPNFDTRGGVAIDMLVLHYTGMKSGQEALDRMCDPAAKVSAHYMIEEDGRVFKLVQESDRAWHAGVSHWRGHTNINARSIGIEIVNPGHEFGYRDFPMTQIKAVSALSQVLITNYGIPQRNVVAHSDIAPERKEDPGELFPWKWLAEEGVGLFPALPHIAPRHTLLDTQRKLARFGYGLPTNGLRDDLTVKTFIAFQRRFRSTHFKGEWDSECEGLLDALLSLAES